MTISKLSGVPTPETEKFREIERIHFDRAGRVQCGRDHCVE